MNKLDTYKKVEFTIESEETDPYRIVKLLIDSTIERLINAKRGIENNDIEVKSKNLNQTIDLISCLQSCLDIKSGNELANSLNDLYTFILCNIPMVNSKNDKQLLSDILDIMRNIKEGWDCIESEALVFIETDEWKQAQEKNDTNLGANEQ